MLIWWWTIRFHNTRIKRFHKYSWNAFKLLIDIFQQSCNPLNTLWILGRLVGDDNKNPIQFTIMARTLKTPKAKNLFFSHLYDALEKLIKFRTRLTNLKISWWKLWWVRWKPLGDNQSSFDLNKTLLEMSLDRFRVDEKSLVSIESDISFTDHHLHSSLRWTIPFLIFKTRYKPTQ